MSRGNFMLMFSQRHYVQLAATLARCSASNAVVAEFVAMLRADNPAFRAELFVKAVAAERALLPDSLARMEDHGAVAAWRRG